MVTTNVADRYAWWLEAVHDLLDHRHRVFPRAVVAELFAATFETAMVSWSWMEPGGALGTELDRDIGWDPTTLSHRQALEVTLRHPLARWFLASRDPSPTSLGRVPPGIGSPEDYRLLAETFATSYLEHQLSVPYRLGGDHYRTFILTRAEEDFSDDDVDLARRVQPLLALLDRQVAATERRACARAVDAGLTPREVAVLVLLADGMTAEAIARRLTVSPRTVHNHLQHVYRKLGVADRMQAVLTAQSLGVICVGASAGGGRRPDSWSPTPSVPDEVMTGAALPGRSVSHGSPGAD